MSLLVPKVLKNKPAQPLRSSLRYRENRNGPLPDFPISFASLGDIASVFVLRKKKNSW
jgi:hypothetical protein